MTTCVRGSLPRDNMCKRKFTTWKYVKDGVFRVVTCEEWKVKVGGGVKDEERSLRAVARAFKARMNTWRHLRAHSTHIVAV